MVRVDQVASLLERVLEALMLPILDLAQRGKSSGSTGKGYGCNTETTTKMAKQDAREQPESNHAEEIKKVREEAACNKEDKENEGGRRRKECKQEEDEEEEPPQQENRTSPLTRAEILSAIRTLPQHHGPTVPI